MKGAGLFLKKADIQDQTWCYSRSQTIQGEQKLAAHMLRRYESGCKGKFYYMFIKRNIVIDGKHTSMSQKH